MVAPLSALQALVTELGALARAASDGGASPAATSPPGQPFAEVFKAAVARLDHTVGAADGAAKGFAAGDREIPLSDVMLSLEKANLGLQLAATVRDKVTAAYSTIMNMPV